MVTISPQEASILDLIEKFAKAGSPREDLQPFINRLSTKKVKDLAEKRIAAVNAPKFKPQPKIVRPPKVKKTRQRMLRTQPVRIPPHQNHFEYLKLAREYRSKTGKHFKRNGWEMRQRMTKLDAVKYRLDRMKNEGEVHEAMKDVAKKNGADFYLSGAL